MIDVFVFSYSHTQFLGYVHIDHVNLEVYVLKYVKAQIMKNINVKYKILSVGLFVYAILIVLITITYINTNIEKDRFNNLKIITQLSSNRLNMTFVAVERSVHHMALNISENIDLKRINDYEYMNQFNETIIDRAIYSAIKSTPQVMAAYFYSNVELYETYNDNNYNIGQWYYSLDDARIVKGDYIKLNQFDINNPDYDWYFAPFRKGPHWTTPYTDPTAFNIRMISYLIPVIVDGITIGMAGMDIKYEIILNELNSSEIRKLGYASLVTDDDIFINAPYFDGKKLNDINNEALKAKLRLTNENTEGIFTFKSNNQIFISAYTRLENNHTLIINSPKENLFSHIIRNQLDIFIFFVLGILIYIITIDYFIKRLIDSSFSDSMTGLNNRRIMNQELQKEIERSTRYGHPISVIFLDIDYFKKINDQYGHATGDKVIIQIAKLIKDNLRKTDFVSRWGGEEFLILCKSTTLQGAEMISQKLHHIFNSTEIITDSKVTCSFGIASWNVGDTVDSLISRADLALYKAKENGRNMVVSENQIDLDYHCSNHDISI